MKRFLDLAICILLLPVWVPVLIATAAVVFFIDGRPLIYADRRAGKSGIPFVLYKFRTMRSPAGPDQPRMITGLGRLLRRSSLDELPQLFNVIRGEMSVVGPRPLPERYLPRYTERQAKRHLVRPGITGLAQVMGRNSISWEQRLELDVWYVENCGLRLDLVILMKTGWSVISGEGVEAPGGGESAEMPFQNQTSERVKFGGRQV